MLYYFSFRPWMALAMLITYIQQCEYLQSSHIHNRHKVWGFELQKPYLNMTSQMEYIRHHQYFWVTINNTWCFITKISSAGSNPLTQPVCLSRRCPWPHLLLVLTRFSALGSTTKTIVRSKIWLHPQCQWYSTNFPALLSGPTMQLSCGPKLLRYVFQTWTWIAEVQSTAH